MKRALLYSNDVTDASRERYRSIYVSTYGIVFLGTPHTGSGMAKWGTVLQAISDAVVPRSIFSTESALIKTLKKDNETLQNINSHFLDIYQRFKILMTHENHMTDLRGTKALIVDANSASPQLPGVAYCAIEATHSEMCKFESENAPGYRTVAIAIRDWVVDAPDVIATRWRIEVEEKLVRAQHDIDEKWKERTKPWVCHNLIVLASRPVHGKFADGVQVRDQQLSQRNEGSSSSSKSRPILLVEHALDMSRLGVGSSFEETFEDVLHLFGIEELDEQSTRGATDRSS